MHLSPVSCIIVLQTYSAPGGAGLNCRSEAHLLYSRLTVQLVGAVNEHTGAITAMPFV